VEENSPIIAAFRDSIESPSAPISPPAQPPTDSPPTVSPSAHPSRGPTTSPSQAPTVLPTAAPALRIIGSPTIPAPVSPTVDPPITAPVSPPVNPPADDNGSKKSCFSDRMTVVIQGKSGETRMDQLQVGDKILTHKGFSMVYTFGHVEPASRVEFLQIQTSTNDQQTPLEITADHLLYVRKAAALEVSLISAGRVKTGDFLVTSKGGFSRVTQIRKVFRNGIYAPFTTAGNLIVNGVVASNYIALPPVFEPHLSFEQQHGLQHNVYSLYRLYCRIVGCQQARNDDTGGFPIGVSMWLPVLRWLERQNNVVRAWFLYLVALPVSWSLFLIELIFFKSVHVILAVLGYYWVLKRRGERASKTPAKQQEASKCVN